MIEPSTVRRFALAVVVAAATALATAQEPVKPSKDLIRAIRAGVPVDPATAVVPASAPGKLGRRTLEALGVEPDRLHEERASTYSATRLEDDKGRLSVFYASVVKQRDRWVFFAQELPAETVRTGSEIQLEFDTERDARYLVDFALDSAEQNFAVVTGDSRTDQAPSAGHLALVVTGTGKRLVLRVLPLGDEGYQTRRFTLFQVTVTPLG